MLWLLLLLMSQKSRFSVFSFQDLVTWAINKTVCIIGRRVSRDIFEKSKVIWGISTFLKFVFRGKRYGIAVLEKAAKLWIWKHDGFIDGILLIFQWGKCYWEFLTGHSPGHCATCHVWTQSCAHVVWSAEWEVGTMGLWICISYMDINFCQTGLENYFNSIYKNDMLFKHVKAYAFLILWTKLKESL